MSKKSLKLKYPKFLLLLLTVIVAYFIFRGRSFVPFHETLLSLGYLGTFLAGIFFDYGFTAAPATAILLILGKEQNIFLAALIAGAGALIGDLCIFKFIRYSFDDEIKKLTKEKLFNHINNKLSRTFKKYILLVLAGFIISSPLPDEIGVSLIAVSTKISTKVFSIISFILNTVGIFIILLIGRFI